MIQFDSYFSSGLVQPPTSYQPTMILWDTCQLRFELMDVDKLLGLGSVRFPQWKSKGQKYTLPVPPFTPGNKSKKQCGFSWPLYKVLYICWWWFGTWGGLRPLRFAWLVSITNQLPTSESSWKIFSSTAGFVPESNHQKNITNSLLQHVDVSENSGTPKLSNFNRVFHYKPSILGYPYFWKHLCDWLITYIFFFCIKSLQSWVAYLLQVIRSLLLSGPNYL